MRCLAVLIFMLFFACKSQSSKHPRQEVAPTPTNPAPQGTPANQTSGQTRTAGTSGTSGDLNPGPLLSYLETKLVGECAQPDGTFPTVFQDFGGPKLIRLTAKFSTVDASIQTTGVGGASESGQAAASSTYTGKIQANSRIINFTSLSGAECKEVATSTRVLEFQYPKSLVCSFPQSAAIPNCPVMRFITATTEKAAWDAWQAAQDKQGQPGSPLSSTGQCKNNQAKNAKCPDALPDVSMCRDWSFLCLCGEWSIGSCTPR